jgi:mono/diheme cytochrome c family protein
MLRGLVASLVLLAAAGVGAAAQRSDQSLPPLIPPDLTGPRVFEFFCAQCHGAGGKGDGPLAPTLASAPTDLTQLARRNGGEFPRRQVEDIIVSGRPVAAHGGSDMPVWGTIFEALEPSEARVKVRLNNVVDHVESIQER